MSFANRHAVGTGREDLMLAYTAARRLWACVLQRAWDDYQAVVAAGRALMLPGRGRRPHRSERYSDAIADGLNAARWFHERGDGVGTFVWTAHTLDLDPDRIRPEPLPSGWREALEAERESFMQEIGAKKWANRVTA